eukprot:NODE_2764_length_2148_cov_15.127660.p1 GENE.NODE_2764_length_2148_cov_15.127660~~NODE_2764_length_2148_cov_15.127660.p1  ORF type:complete len:576 (+),score=124.54 NODE_2764_length_2148_cov_15.127660:250-1728(+)
MGIDIVNSKVRWTVPFSYQFWVKSKAYQTLHDDPDFQCCSAAPDAPEAVRCIGPVRPDYADSCPSLALMMDLTEAMTNPELVCDYEVMTQFPDGLTLGDIFQRRFLNAVNTAVQFAAFRQQFLDKYDQWQEARAAKAGVAKMGVFASEYFDPSLKTTTLFRTDFKGAVSAAEHRRPDTFVGLILNGFQVPYEKHCDEAAWSDFIMGTTSVNPCPVRNFGMFELGQYGVATSGLVESDTGVSSTYSIKCLSPSHWTNAESMLEVIAGTLDGQLTKTMCPSGDDLALHCVADRGADVAEIAMEVEEVCTSFVGIDCGLTTPEICRSDAYGLADWAFSVRSVLAGGGFDACDASRGMFLTPAPTRPECVVLASSVPDPSTLTTPAPRTTTPGSGPPVGPITPELVTTTAPPGQVCDVWDLDRLLALLLSVVLGSLATYLFTLYRKSWQRAPALPRPSVAPVGLYGVEMRGMRSYANAMRATDSVGVAGIPRNTAM